MAKAGLFPREGPRPTRFSAERSVYRALATQLPKGWTAWHSLRVRAEKTWEGEGDFVLAIPDRGALVLEVKGGAIEVRDGQWLQNGRAMEQSPRDQAQGFARLLARKIAERCDGDRPWVAIATAFPDTPFARAPPHGDTDGAVLGQQDLAQLGTALERVAAEVFPREGARSHAPRDARWIDALHAMWGETWTPRLALGRRARMRAAELVALDASQLAILDAIGHNPRLLVRGGAGTGKTTLARELHARAAARGGRVLTLCWTRALATALRAGGLASVSTVREAAAELLAAGGIAMQGGAPSSSWTNATWELATLHAAADAVGPREARYDTVIIDEAQDFSSNDWELVKALAGGGALWAFGDAGQSYWSDRDIPGGLFPASFELNRRYRCPEGLARFADAYRPSAARVDTPRSGAAGDLEVLGEELRVVRIPSATALEDRVALEIAKALGEGASPRDVAVLSLAGQSRTALCAGAHIGRVAVARADAADADTRVVADTFLRFRGLERPWVIVAELSAGDVRARDRYDVRMHIALTRATLGCVVVATAEEIAADLRLAAVAGAR